MPPKLRPRWQLPPSDHNYARRLTHLPVYGENSWPVIVTGPTGIFHKVATDSEENLIDPQDPDDKPVEFVSVARKRGRSRSSSQTMNGEQLSESPGPPAKKRPRKHFKGVTFEPKRRRKRRNSTYVKSEHKPSLDMTDSSFNDSGISGCSNESLGANQHFVHSTNSLTINQGESVLTEGAILLKPSTDADSASGLYNLKVASPQEQDAYVNQSVKIKRICTSCTTQCNWRRKRCGSLPPESDSRRQSERLIKMNYKFPFENLPDVCKLKIFSYLNICEKGIATQVCAEWNRLMKSPGLWSHINFSVFNLTSSQVKPKPARNIKPISTVTYLGQFPWFNTYVEYDEYKNRVAKFLKTLQSIKPKLRSLSFTYDIEESKDDWLKWMIEMLSNAQCLDLNYANIDWTWTPLRLPFTDRYCCLFNKMQIKYRVHEKRVCSFNKLLAVLAKVAPKLGQLRTPFDWSPRSVLLMCRFKQVTTLQLGQYMMLKAIEQEMVDTLLKNMPQLKQLEMKICSPYHNSRTTYSIKHEGLELLDISMCKGFFLHELKCPSLTILKIGRFPWKGPLVDKETNKLLCVYHLCKKGTPRLAYVNRHHIQPYWVEFLYDELSTVLCKVCSCKDHLYREVTAAEEGEDAGGGEEGLNPDANGNFEEEGNNNVPNQIVEQNGFELGRAALGVGNVENAAIELNSVDRPLANIVPLFPLLEDDEHPILAATSYNGREDVNEDKNSRYLGYVSDDARPSTSKAATGSTNKVESAKGKSCSRFKAKRSFSLPGPGRSDKASADDNDNNSDEQIPIEHPTVEIRSTPRIKTIPILGGPTHVAVIPIRVVDPRIPTQSEGGSVVPITIQSIALQPQVIAVDKATGSNVFSGPLTVVKHVIQVIPKMTGVAVSTETNTPSPSQHVPQIIDVNSVSLQNDTDAEENTNKQDEVEKDTPCRITVPSESSIESASTCYIKNINEGETTSGCVKSAESPIFNKCSGPSPGESNDKCKVLDLDEQDIQSDADREEIDKCTDKTEEYN